MLACSVVATAPSRAQARDPFELDDVLDRVTDSVADYTRDFVGVVAEETYRQDVRFERRGFAADAQRQSRTLKSDMLLVRAPAGDRWLQFRDVFAVDGKPVRDREERLAKLFLEPSSTAQQQIADIKAASARYNIGGVDRNINLPLLALQVFDRRNRPWFTFSIVKTTDKVWELAFREERGATMIRGRNDEAAPASGRFVVDRATGRILSSELHADSPALKSQIDVVYGPEAGLGGLLVPREMHEKYRSDDGSAIDGRASYANYRRYTVTVGETLKK